MNLARTVAIFAAIVVAPGAPAFAGPKRLLVLPLDGNVEPALRAKLNQTVQKLARDAATEAMVTVGDATFDETAAAVGCAAAAPKCALAVRTTLGVDELVYGTVTSDVTGQITLVLRRSSPTSDPPTESTATIPAGGENPEMQLAPLFGIAVAAPPPEPAPLPPPPPPPDHTRRNAGIAFAAGGGAVLAIGLVLWAGVSSKQDEIDRAPTRTVDDLRALQDLEDRAEKLAITGDVMVIGGLVLGGVGGWLLYTARRERSVSVAPAVTATGAAVMMRGTW